MRKTFIFVVLVLLFSLGVSALTELPRAANIEVRNASNFDTLVRGKEMVNQIPDPVEPGEYVDVRFKIENIGRTNLKDVLFKVEPKYPFSLDPGVSAIKRVGNVDVDQLGEDAYVVFYRLRVASDALEGDTDLEAMVSKNNGETWEEAGPFKVRIQDRDALLSVISVSTIPEKIQPGEEVTVSIRVRNNAQILLRGIKAQLDLYKEEVHTTSITTIERPFTPLQGSNEKTLRSLDSGKEAVFTFRLLTDSDAASEIYKIPLDFSFSDSTGTSYDTETIIGLQVDEKIDYLLNLERSTAYTKGSKGTATVSISNVGHGDINFVTMELHETDDYKVLSAPLVYLGNIESDDFETAEYEIFVNTKKLIVPLDITIEYKDNYNNKATEKKGLSLKLYTPKDAMKMGLVSHKLGAGSIIGGMILLVLTVFWLFMIMDVIRTKRMKYKKILWVVLVVGSHVIGATIYYFLGRKREH